MEDVATVGDLLRYGGYRALRDKVRELVLSAVRLLWGAMTCVERRW